MSSAWVAVLLVVVAASPTESADPDGWAVDLTGDRAGVSLGTSRSVWWSGRAQITHRRESKGGAFVAIEPLRRFSLTDVTFIAGSWRHAGAWSFYAEAGATPRADFHYRYSGELEAYRRVSGPWVAHAGYRYWAYPGQSVHLVSPRVTRYGRRSELHARLSLVKNTTQGTRSESAFVRGHVDVRPRIRLGGGVAVGERIFDVTSLPREPAPGRVAFVEARVALGRRDSVGAVARVAEEGSTFDQAAFGLTYRRTF